MVGQYKLPLQRLPLLVAQVVKGLLVLEEVAQELALLLTRGPVGEGMAATARSTREVP